MAKIFARKIKETAGTDTPYIIENVPNLWKDSTIAELNKQGYDGYGKLVV